MQINTQFWSHCNCMIDWFITIFTCCLFCCYKATKSHEFSFEISFGKINLPTSRKSMTIFSQFNFLFSTFWHSECMSDYFSFVMVRLHFLFLTLQNQKVISELTIYYYLPWNQGFAWTWYLSQTCNLQAEFFWLDWADKL